MADYTWTGNIDGSLDEPANYDDGYGEASTLPTAEDSLSIPETANHITSGTSDAGTVTTGFNTSIQGGTFWGDVTINGGTFVSSGEFNGPVTANGVDIINGTFNGTLTMPEGIIEGGTFNAEVHCACSISGGTFNGETTNTGGSSYINMATFNGPLTFEDSQFDGVAINHAVSFDGGSTWLYAPNSPSVAPPSKVLSGTANMGAMGTLLLRPAAGQVMGIGM